MGFVRDYFGSSFASSHEMEMLWDAENADARRAYGLAGRPSSRQDHFKSWLESPPTTPRSYAGARSTSRPADPHPFDVASSFGTPIADNEASDVEAGSLHDRDLLKRKASTVAAHPTRRRKVESTASPSVDSDTLEENTSAKKAPCGSEGMETKPVGEVLSRSFLVDRETVLHYWLCLEPKERRSLVKKDHALLLKRLKREYEQMGCDCAECLQKRLLIESDVESRYQAFENELESFALRYEDHVESVVSAGTAMASAVPLGNLSGFGVWQSDKIASAQDFYTFGSTILQFDDVRRVANAFLNNDSAELPKLLEYLPETYPTCSMSSIAVYSGPQAWPKAQRSLERHQMFTVFATRLLEQRVLQAYQSHYAFECRKEKLRIFNMLQKSSLQNNHALALVPSLPIGLTVFRAADIQVDHTKPAITEGAFCDLLHGQHPVHGKVALKRLRVDMRTSNRISNFMSEVTVWRSLKHPHLLPFLGVMFDDFISLVSPFIENGSLPHYLVKYPNVNRVQFIRDLASAIAYLHRSGFVHGDIKGMNILVSSEHQILLCDFGLAKLADAVTSSSKAGMGTLRWQAPELMEGGSKTFKSDVYAFALTMYEILSGKTPFEHHSCPAAIVTAVILHDEKPREEPALSPTGVSYKPLWLLAARCWLKDPDLRPSMMEVDRLLANDSCT